MWVKHSEMQENWITSGGILLALVFGKFEYVTISTSSFKFHVGQMLVLHIKSWKIQDGTISRPVNSAIAFQNAALYFGCPLLVWVKTNRKVLSNFELQFKDKEQDLL